MSGGEGLAVGGKEGKGIKGDEVGKKRVRNLGWSFHTSEKDPTQAYPTELDCGGKNERLQKWVACVRSGLQLVAKTKFLPK